jgi:hypothetical protein
LLKFFWLKGERRKKKSRQAIHTLRRLSDKGRANVFDSPGLREAASNHDVIELSPEWPEDAR